MEAINLTSIRTYLSEAQIIEVVNTVSRSLPTRIDDIADYDEAMLSNTIRVCVDFDIDALGNLKTLSADILNSDWDVLVADSLALSQLLEPVINCYNAQQKRHHQQGKEIKADEKAFA